MTKAKHSKREMRAGSRTRRFNPLIAEVKMEGGRGPLPTHPDSWQVVFPNNVSYTTVMPWAVAPQHVQPEETDTVFFGGSYPSWALYAHKMLIA